MHSLLEFVHLLEKLKCENRHSFKSNGMPETVAEHCWRLCLLVLLFSEKFEHLDLNRCLKMALVHDLPEILTGDTYRLDPELQKNKHFVENKAMLKLTGYLSGKIADEFMGLWKEFEALQTEEARFVHLLDRLEVLVQHNEADITTWSDLEKRIQYGLASRHADKYGYLNDFAFEIDQETKIKLFGAGYHPEKVSIDEYNYYYVD